LSGQNCYTHCAVYQHRPAAAGFQRNAKMPTACIFFIRYVSKEEAPDKTRRNLFFWGVIEAAQPPSQL